MFSEHANAVIDHSNLPKHIAIIMDGNGRWAKKRFLPRVMGHKRGLTVLRKLVQYCEELGIGHLTVFAFSTENWRRPQEEVTFLMGLFVQALSKEVAAMHENGLRLRVIGAKDRLNPDIVAAIDAAEALTANNTGLTLTIAADYGGRWDVVQAANQLIAEGVAELTEEAVASRLCLNDMPDPDLFIRTGGEVRMSNFLLWQMAYAELYFTDTLWPDFNKKALDLALHSYQTRERRFGRTSEQLPIEKQRP